MIDLPADLQPIATGADALPPDLQPLHIPDAASAQSGITIPSAAGNTNNVLTPEQYQHYQQNLQATPLDASYHQQSTAESVRQGIASPFAGTAAMATHLIAGKVGDVAGPGAESAIDDLAHSIQDTNQNHQPGMASGMTSLVTGAAGLAIPGGAVAMGVNDTSNTLLTQIRNEEDNGAPFDESLVKRALIGGGIQTAVNLLMAHGLSAEASQNIINRLAPTVGQIPATVATRAAVGAGLQGAGQVAQNITNNRPIGEGILPAAATGGLMEVGGGVLHDAMGHAPESTAPAQPTPANVPTDLQPVASQAETPAQQPSVDSGLTKPETPYKFGPLYPDQTEATSMQARRTAMEQAAAMKQPAYVSRENGQFKISFQQPDEGWVVHPTGKVEAIGGSETPIPQNAASDATPTQASSPAPIAPESASGKAFSSQDVPATSEAKTAADMVGVGPASENDPNFTEPLEGPMSLKNEHTEQDRAARGLPAPTEVEAHTDEATHAEAVEKIKADSQYPDRLIDEVNKKPRSLSDTEYAALRIRQQELRGQQDEARQAVVDAHESGDPTAMAAHQARESVLSDRLLDLQDAAKASGREQARGFRARHVLLNDDLSLSGMETAKRAVNGGEQLTDAQKSWTSDMHEKLTAADKALTEHEAAKTPKVFSDEDRLKAYKTRLNSRINDLNEQLVSGQKTVKSRTPIKTDAESDALRSYRDTLQKHYDDTFGKSAQPMSDAARLKAYKTRVVDSINDKALRIADEDYTPKTRRALVLDAEGTRLQAENDRLKKIWNDGLNRDRLRQRPTWVKGLDMFGKAVRASVLSGPKTLLKIGSSYLTQGLLHPLDEMAGTLIGKVIPKLADRAAIEGGGFSFRDTAGAIAKAATQGLKDVKDTLTPSRGNMSDLRALYGRGQGASDVLDLPGLLHEAITAPLKRYTFEYAMSKQITSAARLGLDISDPAVQYRMGIESWKYSERGLFREDNVVSDMFNRAVSRLREPDPVTGRESVGTRVAEAGIKTALPVTKVGVNMVGQAFERALGSATGAVEAARAYAKGVDGLQPAEYDQVMRHLKKGVVGGALMLAAYYAPSVFGGFYQRGEKRKSGDVAAGGMKIGDTNVPSALLDNPAILAAQMGATVGRLVKKEGVPSSVGAGIFGLLAEQPFVRAAIDVGQTFDTKDKASAVGSAARNVLIPQLLQQPARMMDQDAQGNTVKRDPKGIVQNFETGIPGLRNRVPVKTQPIHFE